MQYRRLHFIQKIEGTHNGFSVAKTAGEIEYLVKLLIRRM